jgi:hypothetical protein
MAMAVMRISLRLGTLLELEDQHSMLDKLASDNAQNRSLVLATLIGRGGVSSVNLLQQLRLESHFRPIASLMARHIHATAPVQSSTVTKRWHAVHPKDT